MLFTRASKRHSLISRGCAPLEGPPAILTPILVFAERSLGRKFLSDSSGLGADAAAGKGTPPKTLEALETCCSHIIRRSFMCFIAFWCE